MTSNLLPNIVCDFFKPNTNVASYNTRQHSHYHVSVCRLVHTARNIRYAVVKCHAVFGLCLSYSASPHSYKKAVNGMLLTKENWNFNLWFVVCLSRYAVMLFLVCLFMYQCIVDMMHSVLAYVKVRRRRRATPHFFSTSCYLIRMT